jgi:hypothetical protein
MALSLKLKRAKRSLKRAIVAGCIRSLPFWIACTSPRSCPAMSWSDVLRTAKSKARLGALENARGLLASNCIQRAGRCKNDTGLSNTARRWFTRGEQIPSINPKS